MRGDNAVNDPDLATIANAWPDLPNHIKAAILALINAAKERTSPQPGGGQ